MRNWGVYIRNLRKCSADPKILSTLEQIKDLHRNPVIHPEVQIDIDEALSLVGIAESAISRMIADMKDRGPAILEPVLPLEPNPLAMAALFSALGGDSGSTRDQTPKPDVSEEAAS